MIDLLLAADFKVFVATSAVSSSKMVTIIIMVIHDDPELSRIYGEIDKMCRATHCRKSTCLKSQVPVV